MHYLELEITWHPGASTLHLKFGENQYVELGRMIHEHRWPAFVRFKPVHLNCYHTATPGLLRPTILTNSKVSISFIWPWPISLLVLSKFRIKAPPIRLGLRIKTRLIGFETSDLLVELALFSFTTSNSCSKNRYYRKPMDRIPMQMETSRLLASDKL